MIYYIYTLKYKVLLKRINIKWILIGAKHLDSEDSYLIEKLLDDYCIDFINNKRKIMNSKEEQFDFNHSELPETVLAEISERGEPVINIFAGNEFQKLIEQLEHALLRTDEFKTPIETQNLLQNIYEDRLTIFSLITLYRTAIKAYGDNNLLACKSLLIAADAEFIFIENSDDFSDLNYLLALLKEHIIVSVVQYNYKAYSVFKQIINEIILTDELRELVRIFYLLGLSAKNFKDRNYNECDIQLAESRKILMYV